MILEKINVEEMADFFPFFIYQRINMIAGKNPFLFPVEFGYWYFIKRIHSQWPELDAAGAVFAPEISFEINENSRNILHQNLPFPLRLISTPVEHDVQINAAGLLTATAPWKSVDIDYVLPQHDNIVMFLSGQNATPFPAWVDILIMGYMIPDKRLPQFGGTNG